MADPYYILGVPHTASQEEIRSAYHHLARRYHPDLNTDSDAGARMRAINWAYETLSDPRQRARYDFPGWEPPPRYPSPSPGQPQPSYTAARPVKPSVTWTSLLLLAMLVRACATMVQAAQPSPAVAPVLFASPTLTAIVAQVEPAAVGCTAWTGENPVSAGAPACFYGTVSGIDMWGDQDWPVEFVFAGNPDNLRVLLSPEIGLPAELVVGACLQVRGEVAALAGDQPALRVVQPGQLEPCP